MKKNIKKELKRKKAIKEIERLNPDKLKEVRKNEGTI